MGIFHVYEMKLVIINIQERIRQFTQKKKKVEEDIYNLYLPLKKCRFGLFFFVQDCTKWKRGCFLIGKKTKKKIIHYNFSKARKKYLNGALNWQDTN